MSALFITGAGTEAGKTLTACGLIAAARAMDRSVGAFKPVSSGFDPARAETSDAGRLLAALGLPLTERTIDDIAPLRFTAPLSPPDAARREARFLSLSDLERLCRERMAAESGLLLIEGAGGVMSPIADDGLNLDLIVRLDLPVVLAAANYLGAISHILTALGVLRVKRLRVLAVVLHDLESGEPDSADTATSLRRYALGVPILTGTAWENALLDLAAAGG